MPCRRSAAIVSLTTVRMSCASLNGGTAVLGERGKRVRSLSRTIAREIDLQQQLARASRCAAARRPKQACAHSQRAQSPSEIFHLASASQATRHVAARHSTRCLTDRSAGAQAYTKPSEAAWRSLSARGRTAAPQRRIAGALHCARRCTVSKAKSGSHRKQIPLHRRGSRIPGTISPHPISRCPPMTKRQRLAVAQQMLGHICLQVAAGERHPHNDRRVTVSVAARVHADSYRHGGA
jgi:hypothetical protein